MEHEMHNQCKKLICNQHNLLQRTTVEIKKKEQQQRFTALCPDYPGEPVPEETLTHPAS